MVDAGRHQDSLNRLWCGEKDVRRVPQYQLARGFADIAMPQPHRAANEASVLAEPGLKVVEQSL
jgi:hypothetical protein